MKDMKKEDKLLKKAMAELHYTEKAAEHADKVATKTSSKLRKMDSKEIEAQRNVNKHNEMYRAAMTDHEKTVTEKQNLEQHHQADVKTATKLKEELQAKRDEVENLVKAQKEHNEGRTRNLADIKNGFLPGSAPASDASASEGSVTSGA